MGGGAPFYVSTAGKTHVDKRPEVLMLGEPSLGLAPKLLEILYDLLAELREEGTTMLLVDQAAALALSVADRAYVLQSGIITHSGSAQEVGRDPALVHAYLGKGEGPSASSARHGDAGTGIGMAATAQNSSAFPPAE